METREETNTQQLLREEVVKTVEVTREVVKEVEVSVEKPVLQPVEIVREVAVPVREEVPVLGRRADVLHRGLEVGSLLLLELLLPVLSLLIPSRVGDGRYRAVGPLQVHEADVLEGFHGPALGYSLEVLERS